MLMKRWLCKICVSEQIMVEWFDNNMPYVTLYLAVFSAVKEFLLIAKSVYTMIKMLSLCNHWQTLLKHLRICFIFIFIF